MPIVKLHPERLNENDIIRLAGGGEFSEDSPVYEILHKAIKKAESLVDGKGIFQEFPSEALNKHIVITSNSNGTERFPYPGTDKITGIQAAIVFVATIGNALEKAVDQCFQHGNALEGLFLDVAGSVATEAVADQLTSPILEDANQRNLIASYRISPGYCTWNLKLQKSVFRLLDGSQVGVELTKSLLMVPRKSLSGIVFLGEDLHPINPCQYCRNDECDERRAEI